MDVLIPSSSHAQDRGFRRIVWLLVGLVVAPTALLLVIGILMLVFRRSPLNLVFGILVTALVVCLVAGSAIALVLLKREARLSRLQTDFVSKISHELRTPLTSILMFAEMVSDPSADPEERELCIEGIQREAIRLRVQIERLLEWGRMEAGRRSYEKAPLDPGEVVEAALDVFRGSAQGRGLSIMTEIVRPLPPIEGEPEALADALLNLLSNAVKYTGNHKRIAVGASSEGKTVRLFVRDNGPGIARREQRRIFQKFYRADDRLSRAVEGTGLGLAIVQHVAVGHGGRVEVESVPGQGATFSIVLPAATQREAPS